MGRARLAACPETRHYCPQPGCGKSFTRQGDTQQTTILAELGTAPIAAVASRDQTYSLRIAVKHVDAQDLAVDDLDALYAWLVSGSSGFAPPVEGLDDAVFDGNLPVESSGPTCRVDYVLPEPPPSVAPSPTRGYAIDEVLRSRLLAFLFALPELATSTYFACDALSTFLEQYWASCAPTFPVLHGPTFDPYASAGLITTLVVVGMCVSVDKAAYDLGASIFGKMRPLLLLHEVSGPEVPLETFQALVILGQAGQMLFDSREHALSYSAAAHDFGVSRSMDIWYPRWYKRFETTLGNDEERWRAWVASESWSRLCYAIMLRDIQLSSIFGHLPVRALSMLIIRLRTPASDALWTAPSAEAWQKQRSPSSAPFCQVFKDVLAAPSSSSSSSPPPSHEHLNPFALSTVLHGVMSLAWDVKWRGTLRADALAPLHKTLNWRGSLQSAYGRLEREVDDALDSEALTSSERTMSLSSLDLLFVAKLDLVADLTSMLTFAGVMRIGSRNVGPDDFALASRSIRKWVSSEDAVEAAGLAATYLRRRLTVTDLEQGWTFAKGAWAPWSFYLATAMATLLCEQRWGLGKEAGAVLQSLVERRVSSVL
ncbi:uncharacterized protein RHOBADRAFT_53955 [Rhodotorula graminis WP1]|uniref:Xylanolytic transcriptional activator regulatory domain-containing protein n=1 Tax=Rhodotorula graminis (strain WP1) TaxID=578459 RepID=A0A194S389_RHOGW|nr:uncharacterized protein RHOBADRAFT_53955 [Rhodotorula graminis WP1]KPV75057.1 hypothetical protein RHOBADRAFT_53955 [Rhodotorula graminis WP1]